MDGGNHDALSLCCLLDGRWWVFYSYFSVRYRFVIMLYCIKLFPYCFYVKQPLTQLLSLYLINYVYLVPRLFSPQDTGWLAHSSWSLSLMSDSIARASLSSLSHVLLNRWCVFVLNDFWIRPEMSLLYTWKGLLNSDLLFPPFSI